MNAQSGASMAYVRSKPRAEHPGQRDEAWFKREVAPKLDVVLLKEIAAATGLSLAACSRIRAGAKVPHPRHWDARISLVNTARLLFLRFDRN